MRLAHDDILLLLIQEIHVPRVLEIIEVVIVVIIDVIVREIVTRVIVV